MMNQITDHPNPSPPLASEKVAVDRKIFFLDLKENARGRFLKITEDVGGRRDTIMLPSGAFRGFWMRFNGWLNLRGSFDTLDTVKTFEFGKWERPFPRAYFVRRYPF